MASLRETMSGDDDDIDDDDVGGGGGGVDGGGGGDDNDVGDNDYDDDDDEDDKDDGEAAEYTSSVVSKSPLESRNSVSLDRKIVTEQFAVMVEITLQAERAFGIESPIFLRKANMEPATKPQAPASMVSKTALQGEDLSLLMSQQSWW
jgi:hypothetical protein